MLDVRLSSRLETSRFNTSSDGRTVIFLKTDRDFIKTGRDRVHYDFKVRLRGNSVHTMTRCAIKRKDVIVMSYSSATPQKRPRVNHNPHIPACTDTQQLRRKASKAKLRCAMQDLCALYQCLPRN